jgi:threonine dehydrogenase-like Zn-dependent dehydrogenase
VAALLRGYDAISDRSYRRPDHFLGARAPTNREESLNMKALMIEGLKSCALRTISEPELADGGVLLTVKHVGLCGSDLATFTGQNPLVSFPRIPGHEIGAVILQVGAGVPADYAPGRRVIVVPYTSCGKCSSCRKGRVNACKYNRTLGVGQDGGIAERIVLPWEKLILNDTLSPRDLALVEPLAVGFHAARRGRIEKGDRVVVIGCGMVGTGAVAGAAARGAEVIAVDVGRKAELAQAYGARHILDAARGDVMERVLEITGGDGADVVIEAVGLPATFTQAIDLACFAGRVVYIGYSKALVTYETKFFNLKELDIMGSRNATDEDFKAVIAYLEGLGRSPDDLVSKVFGFSEGDRALPYWERERASTMKVMIEF